jgi:hypothetical protein
MTIWLIAVVIFGVVGVTGYYQGAIRALVSLVGLFFALFLTMPLAPFLRPLVPKVGLVHPLWAIVVPPVVVFLLFVLIFGVIAFFVHRKVALHFKYAADDYTRIRWERLNHRLGACVGLVAGTIYFVLISLVIYIFGYPATEVTSDDSPALQRYLCNARNDLHSSGLDRTLASLDPMPENYYLATDILGLLYHNFSMLQERLFDYPAFLALSERAEFQDIATDTDLQNLLQTSAPLINIINNPKILTIVNNSEIMDQLRKVDLKDLAQYLRSGKSAKYDEERILGRWRMDPSATLVAVKRKNPDLPVSQMAQLKKLITIFMTRVSFMTTPDNEAIMKMELPEEAKRLIAAATAAAKPAAAPDPNAPGAGAVADQSRMRARYGPRYNTAPAPTATAAKPKPNPDAALANFNLASTGRWQRDGLNYKVTLKDQKQQAVTAQAVVDDDRLLLTTDVPGLDRGLTLVFVR